MTGLEDAVVRPGPLLGRPVASVLGAATGAKLDKLGLHTVGDLLRHYPRRYAHLGEMTDLASLTPKEHVTVMARVAQATVRTTRTGGALMNVEITDGRSTLSLVFFAKRKGALRYHEGRLKPGVEGLFSGEVGIDPRNRRLQLAHPTYRLIGVDVEDEAEGVEATRRPIPLYPASAQMPTEKIQKAVEALFPLLTPADVPDPLPAELLARRRMPELLGALRELHRPEDDAEIRRAQDRLKFEEAFVLQTELARRRARVAREGAVARPARPGGILDAFDARLPFTLTDGQKRVGAELAAELAGERPMQRLLQGEVGSGKTVVALRAMLQVVDAGGQAALLAPTEVLAAQHERTLRALLGDLAEAGMLGAAQDATRITLLTGSQSAATRRQALAEAASGAAGIVVGTHALLSAHVQFADLGLVVVDEQHRFGVEQRDLLRAKGRSTPHLLVMTATPIPRTVAMTVFGDLETSVLDQVPAGRAEVVTHVVPAGNDRWLRRTWQRVREEVAAGGRAYVVCARIDPDAKDDDGAELVADEGPAKRPLRAVLEVAEELAAAPELGGLPVGVLHGRMTPEEKERALAEFAAGTVPVLVSTTVVEVGVDVPDATVMVVLDADRFGVSQLHQLRGRIGRGTKPGVCLLVADVFPGSPAEVRLSTLAETRDGFRLAAVDLELRREGDVLGAAQSGGATSLRLLRVTRDADVITEARAEARAVVREDPELERHPDLRVAIDLLLDGEREEFLDRT
ncbi:ATP-dependent DNA helicase RecG [Cellulomonas denverensis]|uniref:ATP-dependent DNA helicase RecG n=1 Tax=Cellulomonas denverensis TaxID=264297 RepID=A0A7X6KY55_9CELL|nr:ATP-dependent DNA helicase RecG [Cellulomonas denverensis]NKY24169.1 ATP-dependent DNA helicase RecG [Cellulomonas denverensis]GIG25347.1 ATP-dependent DNA helicase RecG [Cellulomonas denverensis]